MDLSTSTPTNQGDALVAEQVIRRAMILAQSTFKCPFVETSAKEDLNVGRIFTLVVEQVFRELEAALEALNAAANADGSGANTRRNSTISFVVRRISSSNLTVKPIERLSRRFSEPVACAEAVVAAAGGGGSGSQPANSMLSVADPTSGSSATTKAASSHSIAMGSKNNGKHSGSRDQQSSTPNSTHKKKQKNCVIS